MTWRPPTRTDPDANDAPGSVWAYAVAIRVLSSSALGPRHRVVLLYGPRSLSVRCVFCFFFFRERTKDALSCFDFGRQTTTTYRNGFLSLQVATSLTEVCRFPKIRAVIFLRHRRPSRDLLGFVPIRDVGLCHRGLRSLVPVCAYRSTRRTRFFDGRGREFYVPTVDASRADHEKFYATGAPIMMYTKRI